MRHKEVMGMYKTEASQQNVISSESCVRDSAAISVLLVRSYCKIEFKKRFPEIYGFVERNTV